MDYSCIVFDTAPTGHTLRLLQFPTTLQKGLSKLMSLKGMFGGMLSQLGTLFGAGSGENMQDQLLGRLEQLKVGSVCSKHVVNVHSLFCWNRVSLGHCDISATASRSQRYDTALPALSTLTGTLISCCISCTVHA